MDRDGHFTQRSGITIPRLLTRRNDFGRMYCATTIGTDALDITAKTHDVN
jgi:hypothetical protein